jgi:SAM-dependent methyltransferase
MLDRARKRVAGANLKGNVTLVRGDMTDATTVAGGPFGLVIFSLNALMHLPAPDVQLRALQNAHAALDPRGQLIIDIMNPTPEYIVSLAASPALEGSWHLQDGSTVDKWSFRKIDPVAQEISTTLWYDQVGVRGELTRFRSQFDLRYVHLNELRLMLKIAGFTDVREYGSYEMDPLEANSDRIFVTAEVTPAAG